MKTLTTLALATALIASTAPAAFAKDAIEGTWRKEHEIYRQGIHQRQHNEHVRLRFGWPDLPKPKVGSPIGIGLTARFDLEASPSGGVFLFPA